MRFSENTPEPLAPTPTVPAAPTATEPDTTSELMVWSASETSDRSPPAVTGEFSSSAHTFSGVASKSPGSQPMKLRATATPMEAPTPTALPAPTAAEMASTVDEMVEVFCARSATSAALSITLPRP